MSFSGKLQKGRTKNSKGEEGSNGDRFRGDGVKFKCKLVGATDVSDAEGDTMCADAIRRLKKQAQLNKDSGEHKQRIVMYVTLNGIRIEDEKTQEVQHGHALNKISYITVDPNDRNIFAWVFSQPGRRYKLFAVKSEKPARLLSDTMLELFEVRSTMPEASAGLDSSQVSNAPRRSSETSIHEQLREQVELNDHLRRQLREMETHLANCRGQLHEKELQEDSLNWQLLEKNRQKENAQRQLREMEQQLRHCQGQLREKALEETNLRQLSEMERQLTKMEQQMREKDLELENLEGLSREREQQMSHCQEQLREKELQEASLHEQLEEKSQQGDNSQRQLRELEQQLREKDEQGESLQRQLRDVEQQLRERGEHEETLQRQLRERDRELTHLQGQFEEKEDEPDDLQRHVSTLEEQLRTKNQQLHELERTLSTAQQTLTRHRRQQSPDWVIPRDQIRLMTDKELGRGAWGSVVEGKYCGCAVAVKQIHDLILSPHNRNLFEREMNIASKCRYPCLLQFIGATNDEGSPLFVTELMETSLRALLQQRSLSETEVSIISLDVARALSYLHHKIPPIIHRDISSANVLLWRQGDQWRGKVSDYGAANFIQHTMTVGPGNAIYIAPEALTPNQTVKVDVYSFGVLLCEMCIRELPDPEKRDQQIAMVTNHVLRAIIRGCVNTEPEARPSMEEIIDELEESL